MASGWRCVLPLAAVLCAMYVVEVATGRAGSETALLAMGALPLDGSLSLRESWRLVTFSLLHRNATHLLLNLAGLLWAGRVVERRVGARGAALVYAASTLAAGALSAVVRFAIPKAGAAVGASGGICGLLAAGLVLAYRGDAVARFGTDATLRAALWAVVAAVLVTSLLPGVSLVGHLGGLAVAPFVAGVLELDGARDAAAPALGPAIE